MPVDKRSELHCGLGVVGGISGFHPEGTGPNPVARSKILLTQVQRPGINAQPTDSHIEGIGAAGKAHETPAPP